MRIQHWFPPPLNLVILFRHKIQAGLFLFDLDKARATVQLWFDSGGGQYKIWKIRVSLCEHVCMKGVFRGDKHLDCHRTISQPGGWLRECCAFSSAWSEFVFYIQFELWKDDLLFDIEIQTSKHTQEWHLDFIIRKDPSVWGWQWR